jgi:hypothetical protein
MILLFAAIIILSMNIWIAAQTALAMTRQKIFIYLERIIMLKLTNNSLTTLINTEIASISGGDCECYCIDPNAARESCSDDYRLNAKFVALVLGDDRCTIACGKRKLVKHSCIDIAQSASSVELSSPTDSIFKLPELTHTPHTHDDEL